jgi:hypothetical protein
MGGCGLDLFDSDYVQAAGCCEHSNDITGFYKMREFVTGLATNNF